MLDQPLTIARRFRTAVAAVFAVAATTCLPVASADDASSKQRDRTPSKEVVPFPIVTDPVVIDAAIKHALAVWRNPESDEAEFDAVCVLFGELNPVEHFLPPDHITKMLVVRGLDYRNWKSRQKAAWEFQYKLEDNIPALIRHMRVAINDPHSAVRLQAVVSLEHAMQVVVSGPVSQDWDAEKEARLKEEFKERGHAYLDEIIDLLVTKGVTDEHSQVADFAITALLSDGWATPNATRLRALNRVLTKGHVHREARDIAEDLRDKWAELLARQAAQQHAPDWQRIEPEPPLAGHVGHEVKRALEVWRDPRNDDAELQAVSTLFGKPEDKHPVLPPQGIVKLLVARGLDYKHWKSRYTAVGAFPYLLEDDVPRLIAILRDALNDPNWEVRVKAVQSLGDAIASVANGPTAKHWSAEKRAKVEKNFKEHGQEYLDQMIDLVITKGLTDERRDVADVANETLTFEDVKPNTVRLRALERVIAKRQVHFRYEDAVSEVRDAWIDSTNRRAPDSKDRP
jgi:hypothetical protein